MVSVIQDGVASPELLQVPTLAARRVKRRYNLSFFPEDVVRMDSRAASLGVSRSELLAYCFNRFESDCRMSGDE